MPSKMLKQYLCFFLLFGVMISFSARSQTNEENKNEAGVQLQARANKDRILLRWAVNRPLEWQKANTYGFYLDKYVYKRNGKRVQPLEKVNHPPFHIMASPVENWKEIIETNDYAAIIAQALYGEGFEVTGKNEGKLASVINMAQELDQRFSFSLFAADMNFEAAVKAGWGYIDTNVKPNEEYVYQVRTAIPSDIATVKSASVTAGTGNIEQLPPPIGLQGIWGDQNVLLTWDYELFKGIYTSYNVERSKDGENFNELSPIPLVNLNDTPEAPAKRMYYIDSLAQNNTRYYYRVYGISPFGEKGLVSETISGEGSPTLIFTPRIRDYEFTENENEAIIRWEYPEEGEELIGKFTMTRANTDSGPYEVVFDSIPVDKREIVLSNLNPSNYLKIAAIGQNQKKESFSSFIQPIDSIPPQPPVQLQGMIDSLGISKISWAKNQENDLRGYRVFRANLENEEFVQLTVSPIHENVYTDSVQLKSLNSKVYYRVIAVDKRYNQSNFSETLIIEKPDVVPPSAPVFSNYKTVDGKVVLEWELSGEPEATHFLYRKNLSDNSPWTVIYSTTDAGKTYTDEEVTDGKTYRYVIMARDKASLDSEPSTPLTITVVNMMPREYIRSLAGYASREDHYIELNWKLKDADDIAEIIIYKNRQGEPPVTFKILPQTITTLQDKEINPNNTYSYWIRATLISGGHSKIEAIDIKY